MIHPGLIPPPAAREGHKPKTPNCPPTPTGILAVRGQLCPGKAHSLHGTPSRVSAWKEARGGPLHLPTQTLLTSMGAEPPRALQSLSCWVPAHSASSLQRACVPLPPWLRPAPPAPQAVRLPSVPGVGSRLRGFAGGLGKGSRPMCRAPLPPENGGDPSARPGFPRRQVCP